ncbi:S8 family serine peptidase [Anabaena sp. UHCC 0399]|uniref:S8 family serine peptidase n=1 Tax=Anabaena sp. UHCC 0399 TaxID=3110238 RepID=UPI002B211032|nr:S8 family serine peptidase [Anabaena sp. UHCC 0399]MEA5567573.1 S8 family serine peptidase [Anabaena sp. UHCC 0399]
MLTRKDFLLFTGSLSMVLMSPLMVYAQVSGEPYNPYQVPVDQANNINSAFIPKTGLSTEFKRSTISRENIYQMKFPLDKKSEPIPNLPKSKISPTLEKLLLSNSTREEVEIIITFKEDLTIPLLPELKDGEEREKSQQRQAAIEEIKAQRIKSQMRLLEQYKITSYFKPTEHFWITNAVAGKTRFSAVRELAQLEAVAYIQPVYGGEKPPDAITNNDVDNARAIVFSDPYFNLGLTHPWIGLLDTGVRSTHVLFNSPSNLAWLRDCVNGGANCNTTTNPGYNTDDDSWDHGTSTAAIISGNGLLGNTYRGITGVSLDSWKIYTNAGLNSAAAIRGIQAGVAAFDKVLVGELQAQETENGAIATAADNAYNAGVIFVSANGNFGPDSSTVRSPAIAHKVIGVGGIMTTDQTQYNDQGRGPATDGRFKPDIQAPTFSETASNASASALQVFGGTSGATPYASGVAMLARNWLRQFGTYDNGQTYAFMILYGQKSYPYNNTVGAGVLKMATNGWAHWGKVVVNNGSTIDIPINVGSGKQDFDASLWWPESAAQAHNDIDVHLIDPSGVERARGYSALSIFERARVAGNLTPGTWKIRIRGYNVPTGGQLVYWASHIRN